MKELQSWRASLALTLQNPKLVVVSASGAKDFFHTSPSVLNIGCSNPVNLEIKRDGLIEVKKRGQVMHSALIIGLVGSRFFTESQLDALFGIYLNLKASAGLEPKNWHCITEFNNLRGRAAFDMDFLRDRLATL